MVGKYNYDNIRRKINLVSFMPNRKWAVADGRRIGIYFFVFLASNSKQQF